MARRDARSAIQVGGDGLAALQARSRQGAQERRFFPAERAFRIQANKPTYHKENHQMTSLKKLLGFGATAALAGIAVASVTAAAFASDGGEASSHREAPAISADPLADTTDVYAFIAPDAPDKLTIVGNWIPLEEPAGGPNFYNFGDDVSYEFSIDNNGDAREDVTYEYRFRTTVVDPTTFLYATGPIDSLTDPNFNIRQTYDVYRNGKKINSMPLATPPNNIGPVSTPNYDSLAAQAVYTLADGSKHFAGQRDDPFFVDLGSIFDLATIRVLPGNNGGGVDGVGGFNTHSIVLQVPLSHVTKCKCDPPAGSNSAVLGVWSDTYRNRVQVLGKDGGRIGAGRVQVSRLGNPLVNEVVIPLSAKDRFNGSDPKDDAQFGQFVLNSDLAGKFNAVYGLGLPTTGRTDLATVFLTGIPGLNQPPNPTPSEQLRINVGIKPASCGTYSTLGVIAGDNCGFPNGRRLADDVTDVELRAVACGYGFDLGPCDSEAGYAATTEQLGDGVDGNDKPFMTSFPYVASPHSGFDHDHHTGSVVVPVMAGLGGAGAVLLALIAGAVVLGFVRRARAGWTNAA
jgi:hypothetical protein